MIRAGVEVGVEVRVGVRAAIVVAPLIMLIMPVADRDFDIFLL